MNLFLLGLNHKTAPIDIREKFYLRPLERELLLSEFKNNCCISEALVISTCNRTEIYAQMIDNDPQVLWRLLFKIKNIPFDPVFKKHFFEYSGPSAVKHLFHVAAGLDSLILGEKQILGQIKDSFELSRKNQMTSKYFNVLCNFVLRTGKKARLLTQIDYGGSSISWAAVVMAQRTLGSLEGKSVFIIGAGKMGKIAVRYLREKGAEHIFVANRTHENMASLAGEERTIAVSMWDIKEILSKVDVCICSTSAPHYLIEKDLIERVMPLRNGRNLVCIDISMPRNIEPSISDVAGVSLFAIDDLDKVLEENINRRAQSVGDVESIVEQKVTEFYLNLNKRREMLTAENPAAIISSMKGEG